MMNDPYGLPSPYRSEQEMCEALNEGEPFAEVWDKLSEMGIDTSDLERKFIYVDKFARLWELWRPYWVGEHDMWLLDLALWQMSFEEGNYGEYDSVYDRADFFFKVLSDEQWQKKIGFKKMFFEILLSGNYTEVINKIKKNYKNIINEIADKCRDLDRFIDTDIATIFHDHLVIPYDVSRRNFWGFFNNTMYKLQRLELHPEKILIAETKAVLTSFDDFVMGLEANQALSSYMEIKNIRLEYQKQFEKHLAYIYASAEAQGVELQLQYDVGELPLTKLENNKEL